MKPEEIKFNDWLRILVGEVPFAFFIELVIRALVVYLILLIAMRIMGKRMSSLLNRNELAALVSLAAAVGIPLMAPDRGLLPGVVIAVVLVIIQRIIARQTFKNQPFERYSQGDISTLVADGVINMNELSKIDLSHERLLAQLRSKNVLQLGTVSRFYMESGGSFTLINNPKPSPGLPILPPWDNELHQKCFEEVKEVKICLQCAYPQKQADNKSKCPNCGLEKSWINAVEEKE
jgi:uncharacterized membrane protein YcaP (DUF421 family)